MREFKERMARAAEHAHQATKPLEKLNQISPQQRGYRDGWKSDDPKATLYNPPYTPGTWAFHQWADALVQGARDRAIGNTH